GDLCFNEIVAANVDLQMSPAFNFDGWVELYNSSDLQVNLGGCYLSDDPNRPLKWQLPDDMGVIPSHSYRQLWLGSNEIRYQQAPFSLNCEGGALFLSNAFGELVASQAYPPAISRCSYARTTDGGEEWSWTATPTPAATNTTSTFTTVRTEPPTVTPGAVFDDEIRIVVRVGRNEDVRYTTDGTTPTLTNGNPLTARIINVNSTTTYRFRSFKDGELPSEVVTRTYLKREREHLLPIIYVSAPDDYFYDDSIGVYVRGVNGRTGNGQSSPVNWNMDWNRPVNFQYMLPDQDEMVFNQDVDFRISGGWTRSSSIKSFKLKADRVYENKNTMDYPFFAAKPFIRNKALQVRRGGNDGGCRIKDAALHEILQRSAIDLDVMSYQPVVHYINGEYKGLINIREPNNKDFAFANFGLSKDELEVYEQSPDSGAYMMIGSPETLLHLYDLSANAADEATYAEICSLVDMDEFVNYMAAELYLGSWDWPDNNLKAYRKADGGRFRITFFDLDAAFGTDGRGMDEEGEITVGGNTFRWIDGMQWHRYDYIYDTGERRYGEIKFCTFFMNLMANADFRRKFATTFCLMGSVFEPTRASTILDELGNRVRPTMSQENSSPDGSLNEIRERLKGRGASMTKQMKQYERMQLTNVTPQKVHIYSDTEGCNIYVNEVKVPYGDYSGELFPPAQLRAEPRGGYRFVGWRYAGDSRYLTGDMEMALPAGSNLNLEACFAKMSRSERLRKGIKDVRVNEVMAANSIYQSDYFKRSDWVELFNATADTIDLEGWYLSDDLTNLRKYQISADGSSATTKIAPFGYLLIWCDKREPLSQLHASFNLAAEGGLVALTNPDESQTDILYYPPHTGLESVARFPDGANDVSVTNIPTIEFSNRRSSYLVPTDQKALGVSDMATETSDLSLQYVAGQLVVTSPTQP
nr:CotH kinase family protein [Bacteroidaceae bacterium]